MDIARPGGRDTEIGNGPRAPLGDTPPKHLAYSSHIPGDGAAAYALAAERGFEGLISKRADRPYVAGRSDDWRKTKHLASDEYAVVGTMAGKGSRSSGFGSSVPIGLPWISVHSSQYFSCVSITL